MGRTDKGRSAALAAVILIAGCGSPAGSGSLASPTITCTGVPQVKCDEGVAGALRSLPNTSILSIEVVCVADRCTEESGAMDTVVRTADDGTLRSATSSWSAPAAGDGGPGEDGAPGEQAAPDGEGVPGAVPPATPVPVPSEPDIPVQPQCQGVPRDECEVMAETAFGELSTEGVSRILVRCGAPAPCTPEHGIGQTVVTYEDGTTGTSEWEYASD
jgi:hypothetical protein